MQLPALLRGIVPPLVTPLAGRGDLDHAGLEILIDRVIGGGCAGIFVLGSTGEAQALSYRLRLEMVRESCRLAQGRVPVLAGISDTSVAESIEFGRAAADAGAAGLVATPPYYFRMGQRDVLHHAEMLALDLPVPIFLYNIPSLTKLWYEPETVAAAARIPGIAGLKDSSADLIYLQRVLHLVGGRSDFSVLVGPEEILGPALLLGAHGGVSGGANLMPELYVDLYNSAIDHRFADMAALQRKIMEVSERVYHVGDAETSYIRGLKCALHLFGLCSDLPAPPLARFTDEERATMEAHLQGIAPFEPVVK